MVVGCQREVLANLVPRSTASRMRRARFDRRGNAPVDGARAPI